MFAPASEAEPSAWVQQLNESPSADAGQLGDSRLPSKTVIETWIQGDDPRLVAWGAHDAVLLEDEALVPDLLAVAARWRSQDPELTTAQGRKALSPEQWDQRDAMSAVVETLVQLQAEVPASTVRLLAPDFGNAAAILLSRLPVADAQTIALELFRMTPAQHTYADIDSGVQYVSAFLLASHPVPGFAKDLLSGMQVHGRIYVVDRGGETGGGGSGIGCGVIAVDKPHPGWPMIGQYRLSTVSQSGSFPLTAGSAIFYAMRYESTHALSRNCGGSMVLTDSDRRDLVAEMLDTKPDALGWNAYFTATIEYDSAGQFEREVLAEVANQQSRFRATIHALVGHNLVNEDEGEAALPQLLLHVNDMRAGDHSALEAPAVLPEHVGWCLPLRQCASNEMRY